MDDAFLDQSHEPIANLPQHLHRLSLWTLVVALNVSGKIAITEFLDDIVVFAAFHDIVKPDYVFGVNLLEDVDLIFEGGFEIFVMINLVRVCLLLSFGRILTATVSSLPSFFPRYTLP
jgi:hypothetical protein